MIYNKIKIFFKKWSQEIANLFLAFVIVSSLLYVRLVPRIARDLWESLNYYQIFSISLNIIFLLIELYYILILLTVIKPPKPKLYIEKFLSPFANIGQYIKDILINFYQFSWYILGFLIEKLFGYKLLHYNVIRKVAKHYNATSNFKYYCWSLIAIKFVPKIIIVMAFFVDVIIYKHLDYTFKCLPLLLVSLLEQLFLFLLQDFYYTHLDNVCSFIEKEPIPGTDEANFCFIPKFREEPPDFVEDFSDYFFNHYLPLIDLLESIEAYEIWKNTKFPSKPLQLMLCMIRLLLYIYILIYGLTYGFLF